MPVPWLGRNSLLLACFKSKTTLPLSSILAASSGGITMFGRDTLSFLKRL